MVAKFSRIIAAGFLLAASPALAQQSVPYFPQTINSGTVVGRLSSGPGPTEAIPFASLVAALSSSLSIGVPAHSVVIGKGSTVTGFNGAAPSTTGQVLIDQGSASDPAFKPITGSCTLAANGAISCGSVGGGVNSVAANYAATNSDCFKTIAAGGNTQITITVNSASSYGVCTIDISNVDTWGSGHGKLLSVSGLATNPPVLYPGMTVTLLNINGAWFQKPGISVAQAPLGTKLYVDVNGADSNDCLAAATACQTLNHVFMQVLWQWLEATAGSSSPAGGSGGTPGFDIRLIADPSCVSSTGVNCIHGLHYSGIPKQLEGHNAVMIECDAGTATSCTIADNSGNQAIGCFVPINLELKNVTLTGGSSGNNAIQAERCMVRTEGGVVLGNTGSNPQISALDHGVIVVEGTTVLTVAGSGSNLAQTSAGGIIVLDQSAIQWTSNSTYSQTLNANTWSLISANGTSWQVQGNTVTATFNIACGPGGVVTTGGTISSVPGTNTQSGCTATGNGQVN
jgi:hypothetical protein